MTKQIFVNKAMLVKDVTKVTPAPYQYIIQQLPMTFYRFQLLKWDAVELLMNKLFYMLLNISNTVLIVW